MKNLKPIVALMLFVTSMVFSQTFKVTAGVDFMDIRTSITPVTAITDDPTDDPTDGPIDVTARAHASKSGSTINNASSSAIKVTTNETGFYLGLALSDLNVFGDFYLQPEVRFVGVKDFNQIQVPVLLSYGITEKFHAFAGPNFAFLLDAGDALESFNFALDFGLSYDVSEKISIDARYDWGQTNLLDGGDSNNYLKINNIQFGLAYHFGK